MSNPMDQATVKRPDPVGAAKNARAGKSPAPRTTRKPTGLPSWPVLLLAGREKTGKSYQAALASASDMVGRTLWLGFGEKDPDEYGAIPGARFEIVPHDGTLNDLYDAIRWAVAEPPEDGKKNLIILDSATRVWDSLRDEATASAVARKAFDKNGEPVVGMDLWNKAKARWMKILGALRAHNGPVILTARLDTVAVIGNNGKPTSDKTDKIKGQKDIGYDVDAIVEMPQRGEAWLTGARSVVHKLPQRMALEKFDEQGVDWLWRSLGLDKHESAQPSYTEPPVSDE